MSGRPLMKRKIMIGMTFILLATLISGCARISQKEFDYVVADKDAALVELASLQSKSTTIENDLNTINAEKDAVRAEVNSLQKQLNAVQVSLTNTNAEVAAREAQITELEAQITTLGKEVADLIRQFTAIREGALGQQQSTQGEKPQYSGIATIALTSGVSAFDEAFGSHSTATTLHLTNEELMQGDWRKGPSGTNQADFILPGINNMDLKTGCLAEGFVIPEIGTMVFLIRDSVYWQNKEPTNGRKLTIDDIVFSLKRMCTEAGSYIKMSYPNLCNTISITGDEKNRLVTLKCPVTEWANMFTIFPDFISIMPRDAIEKFGNMNDWRNSIGTGAFILTDYVSNASATFIKNPNYWQTNPIGPGKGDRLPYMEGVKMLVITDSSTRKAAFRLGKIDCINGEYGDIKELMGNPGVKQMEYTMDYSMVISMRTDKTNLPFSKKEVRQALTMAIDFNAIKNQYYFGKADIFNWPICNVKEYSSAFIPLEQLPANCQELYSYNVVKAKNLLATAGYSSGFLVTVITSNTPSYIEYLALVKSMWAGIGVNMTIQVMDSATYYARVVARNYDSMMYHSSSTNWQKMQNFTGTSQYNMSYVNDPVCNEAVARSLELIGVDEVKLVKNFGDLVPYVVEQCFQISKPNPYNYVLWGSWVKNWSGEQNVGYYNYPSYLKYIWIDTALKK
jgi:peptide/nickel transport system substrate-binding protein